MPSVVSVFGDGQCQAVKWASALRSIVWAVVGGIRVHRPQAIVRHGKG
ncbi:hypothetical protein [Edwardsiella tarda]